MAVPYNRLFSSILHGCLSLGFIDKRFSNRTKEIGFYLLALDLCAIHYGPSRMGVPSHSMPWPDLITWIGGHSFLSDQYITATKIYFIHQRILISLSLEVNWYLFLQSDWRDVFSCLIGITTYQLS